MLGVSMMAPDIAARPRASTRNRPSRVLQGCGLEQISGSGCCSIQQIGRLGISCYWTMGRGAA